MSDRSYSIVCANPDCAWSLTIGGALSQGVLSAISAAIATHHASHDEDVTIERDRYKRKLEEIVTHVEQFCTNPDTVAWVQQRSGLRAGE